MQIGSDLRLHVGYLIYEVAQAGNKANELKEKPKRDRVYCMAGYIKNEFTPNTHPNFHSPKILVSQVKLVICSHQRNMTSVRHLDALNSMSAFHRIRLRKGCSHWTSLQYVWYKCCISRQSEGLSRRYPTFYVIDPHHELIQWH